MKKRFPHQVEARAVQVCQQLAQGLHWSQIGGRKLRALNTLIVFELPFRYRLVCWLQDGLPAETRLMTHQRYNAITSISRR